jgi:transcriptional regulator of acetoin/glycerol metabolism
MKILLKYNYPGNIRELENIIEHAAVLCNQSTIEIEHLPQKFTEDLKIKTPKASKNLKKKEESERIMELLEKFNGNLGNICLTMRIDRSTLWRKMKKYNIDYKKY